jgi:hypothetical protein
MACSIVFWASDVLEKTPIDRTVLYKDDRQTSETVSQTVMFLKVDVRINILSVELEVSRAQPLPLLALRTKYSP